MTRDPKSGGAGSSQVFVTAALVLAAIVMMLVAAKRSKPGTNVASESSRPLIHEGPSDPTLATSDSRSIGSPGARIVIVEFSDFQCPYCAELAKVLDSLRARHQETVRIVYRHFPIVAKHPAAFSAAVVAECAGAQGRFEQMHDALFANQQDVGRSPWTRFAALAGIPDNAAFQRCVKDSSVSALVRRDMAAGVKLGIRGTPNLIIGPLRIEGYVSLALLDSLVTAAIK